MERSPLIRAGLTIAAFIVFMSLLLILDKYHETDADTDLSPTSIALSPYLREQAVVHAVVNGHPGTFLFDTGEGLTSISPKFAKRIGCHPWGQITGHRMSGERLDNKHCDNIKFVLSGRSLVAPSVITLDIMSLIGPGRPPVDGALGLDIFANQVITIIPRKAIIVETPASLKKRIAHAKELPVRLVSETGTDLSVNAAVRTPMGLAWMELDDGNGGSLVVANHIAPLLGLATDIHTPTQAHFELANGIPVSGPTRTRDLIMDGNISAQFLNHWNLTLDLRHGKAWLSPTNSKPLK